MSDTEGSPPIGGPWTLRERRRQQPPRLAKAAIAAASWQLPPGHRSRYRLEFFAELHGLGRPEQVRYAGSLLVHSWSLAAALNDPEQVLERAPTRHKDMRCALSMHHYVRCYASDADLTGSHYYLECTRCRKVRDVPRRNWGWML